MTEPTVPTSAPLENVVTHEKKPCDLVMKGGITSGVVYPPAIVELSKTYRFHNIGGASAGAIAAAATAAAQFGDLTHPGDTTAGFARLLEKSNDLTRSGFLIGLFQPHESCRRLFEVALTFIRSRHPLDPSTPAPKWVGSFLSALIRVNLPRYLAGFLTGFVVPLGLMMLLVSLVIGSLSAAIDAFQSGAAAAITALLIAVAISVLLALGIGLLFVVMPLYRTVRYVLPTTYYGLCPGHASATAAPALNLQPPLTDWLTSSLNEVAGLTGSTPLTFGDLRQQGITLRLITTNLTYGQPFVLPFETHHSADTPAPFDLFMFNVRDLHDLFPQSVVTCLDQHARTDTGYVLDPATLADFRFLPLPDKQPVVFAARLSLSFPVLLSAIPLYSIKPAAYDKTAANGGVLTSDDIDQNWFSDGGISSNFPIHFFDSWLPARPTFGIFLTSVESTEWEAVPETPQTRGGTRSPDDFVHLPHPREPIYPSSNPIAGLFGFAHAIWRTAQTYRDSTQAVLPGYRERIIKVALEKGEGGLNLAMDKDTIAWMQRKGTAAGARLTGIDFDVHRWLRFRTISAELERQLTIMRQRYVSGDYAGLLQDVQQVESAGQDRFPFYVDDAWIDEAIERTEQLTNVWADIDEPLLARNPPTPSPVLRATPPT